MITQIRAALAEDGTEPIPEDVADFLLFATWLATHTAPARLPFVPRASTGISRVDTEDTTSGSASLSTGLDPLPPVPIGGPPTLRNLLELGRALRPLRVRKPSPDRVVLDEETTAGHAAERRRWEPVTRPELVRWPDLALVVDDTPSMEVWSNPLRQLRLLLERLGAFREIRSWRLAATACEGRPGVAPGLLEPAGRWRDAGTLADPTGRRMILVVTDGANPAWRGSYRQVVAQWGRTNPVGLLSVVPYWWWPPQGLGAQPGHVYASQAPSPNTVWDYLPHRQALRRLVEPWIPVVELTTHQLEQFAAALGAGRRWVAIRLVDLFNDSAPMAAADTDDDAESPYDLVEEFRGTASPTAFRLLTLLSAVPLTVKVMELVQRIELPEAGPAHLAEILLSDLVDDAVDRFVFRSPEVREVLQRRLEPAEKAGLRRRAYHETDARPELFDHPDGDPAVVSFVRLLPATRPHALAITGVAAPRRVAAVFDLVARLPWTRGKAIAPPLVVRAAELVQVGRGASAERVHAVLARAGRGVVLIDDCAALADRDLWGLKEGPKEAVSTLLRAVGDKGSPLVVLGGLAGEVRAVLDQYPDLAALVPANHVFALSPMPPEQAYEICRGLFRGDRLSFPRELERRLWDAFADVRRATWFQTEHADRVARDMYCAVLRRWQERAARHITLTAADIAAAAAQVIEEWNHEDIAEAGAARGRDRRGVGDGGSAGGSVRAGTQWR